MKLSEELMLKLERAGQLLFDVQHAVLREDELKPVEQRDGHWRRLYKLRIDLGNELDFWKRRGKEHDEAANKVIEAGEEG